MRYFALGVGKGWVQIRMAKTPPVANESEAPKVVKFTRMVWDSLARGGYGDYVNKPMKKKMIIKVCVFEGGKTVDTMTSKTFSSLFKVGVREGGMLEMTDTMVQKWEEKRGGG